MRLLTLLFIFAASAAQAKDCIIPKIVSKDLKGVIEFSKCIQQRVGALEAENADLRKELKALQKLLADVPGELINVNGRETRRGGQLLTQASFTLPARSGDGMSFLAVDDKLLGDLCAQGCSLFLQVAREDLRGTTMDGPTAIGPCTFRYAAKTGAWSLDNCGAPVSGVDGDGKATGPGGGEAVASAGEACILADAEPLRGVEAQDPAAGETLGRDRGRALYLIAESSANGPAGGRFRCELKFTR
jgi:hypothetical protein